MRGTLNNPIIMDHANFIEPALLLIMRINVGNIHFQHKLHL